MDLAFNNAGITPGLVDVHEIDIADWAQVIEINLTGIFHSMKAELTHMLEHGGGAIVNMASTAGLMAHAGRAAYSASKHGIVGLTRSAAVEYAQRGVRINAVAPGPIDAPSAQALPPEVRASIAAKTAMNRIGQMSDVAAVVSFLLSDQAAFVTGSVYEVNGGQTQLFPDSAASPAAQARSRAAWSQSREACSVGYCARRMSGVLRSRSRVGLRSRSQDAACGKSPPVYGRFSTRTSQFPELSRRTASIPYGRSAGSWTNSTPRALSSS